MAGFLWFTGILEDSFYVAAFSVFLCLVHGFISHPVIIKIRRGILFIDCGADAYADGNTASVQFPGAQKYFFADTFHKPFVTGLVCEQPEFVPSNAEKQYLYGGIHSAEWMQNGTVPHLPGSVRRYR